MSTGTIALLALFVGVILPFMLQMWSHRAEMKEAIAELKSAAEEHRRLAALYQRMFVSHVDVNVRPVKKGPAGGNWQPDEETEHLASRFGRRP